MSYHDEPMLFIVGIAAIFAIPIALIQNVFFEPKEEVKKSDVYEIHCTLAGVTTIEGYASRDGIVRQDYIDKDTYELVTTTLIPGTECTKKDYLTVAEWKKIKGKIK